MKVIFLIVAACGIVVIAIGLYVILRMGSE